MLACLTFTRFRKIPIAQRLLEINFTSSLSDDTFFQHLPDIDKLKDLCPVGETIIPFGNTPVRYPPMDFLLQHRHVKMLVIKHRDYIFNPHVTL